MFCFLVVCRDNMCGKRLLGKFIGDSGRRVEWGLVMYVDRFCLVGIEFRFVEGK